MKWNPVGWFEIYVDDLERAKRFYESVFQIQLTRIGSGLGPLEMWAFPALPENKGCSGALVKMPGLSPEGVSTIVYFTSLDCSVEEKRVVEAGGKIHKSKFSIGEYGFICLATDTEGTMFGIHSRK